MEPTDLIEKFWDISTEVNISALDSLLYLYLIHNWNKNQKKDFELSDVEIQNNLRMSRKTIKKGKDCLRNLGLISYQVKNGFPTFYKIITDYSVNRKITTEKTPLNGNTPTPVAEKQSQTLSPNKPQLANTKHPSFQEFLAYAKTLEGYSNDMDVALKNKYITWQENNWINGYGRTISNWKQTLRNSLPYLKNSSNDIFQIPNIKRPKNTYNE